MVRMNKKWFKLSSVLVIGAYLAACGDAEEETADEDTELVEEDEDVEETDDHDHEEEHDHDEEDDHDHEEDDDHDHDEEDHDHGHGDEEHEAPETVEIEGIEHHYHTGELIELTAVLDEEVDYDHWHWYIREDEADEWETVPEQGSEDFIYEAPEESFEIRAVLFGDDHDAHAQSPAEEIVIDNH